MLELKSFVAHLLNNFWIEPVNLLAHEIPISIDLVLRPSVPIQIKFIPIEA